MAQLGKGLIGLGILLILVGSAFVLASRTGFPLGRLPGDFSYRSRNLQVYFPLGTSILISILLTVILYILSHLRR